MASKYLFDTNSLIDLGQRHYPKDLFVDLWNHIYIQIDLGLILITDGVVSEITDKIDDPEANRNAWRNGFLQHANNSKLIQHGNYQSEYSKIANKCNSDVKYRGNRNDNSVARFLSKADVWLIAIAQKDDVTLVTQELPGTLKIPTICSVESVKCINMIEYFRHLNMKFKTSID